jgi:adenylosuccinate synthase
MEAIEPVGMQGFGHVEEHCVCQPLLADVPGYSFKEAGQLQARDMPGSKHKLFISQQPTVAYLMPYHCKQDRLKELANRVY